MCVSVYLGEDAQHGAGQGPRRGTGSGQSVAADPTVSVSQSLVDTWYSYLLLLSMGMFLFIKTYYFR